MTMLWFLYNILFTIGYLLMLPHFLARMWKRGGYRKGFLQRLGVYDQPTLQKLGGPGRIWIHAVSVGEVYVALRFMEELRPGRAGRGFVLSTTTSTGHKLAESKVKPEDVLLYYPVDFPAVVRRVLDIIRPPAILLTESELWPNLVRLAARRKIPVILLNGRISQSSFRGYRAAAVFFRRILHDMELLLVQSDGDGNRLIALGAEEAKVKVIGSAKYDMTGVDAPGQDRVRAVLDTCGMTSGCRAIVGGSTWPGEERILMDVFKRIRGDMSDLKLILVPRHAERREEVEREIRESGLAFTRRSDVDRPGFRPAPGSDVLLVDTTGELKSFYTAATAVFVGKSLTAKGGQNPLEPAMLGKATIVGPHMSNFEGVVADLVSSSALIQVQDADGLERALRELLSRADFRRRYEDNGRSATESRKGAVAASVKLILSRLGPAA